MKRSLITVCSQLGFLSVFGVLAGCVAQVDEVEEAMTAEQPLLNASIDGAGAWRAAVVKIAGCTGTLVSSRHVLTSGHCLPDNPNPDGRPESNGNWETPGTYYRMALPRRATDCCNSGKRRPDGSFSSEPNVDFPGGDLRSLSVGTDAECRAACAAAPECSAYTFGKANGRCWLKDGAVSVAVGIQLSDPHMSARATHYNIAGYDDIVLVRLDRNIPWYVATPSTPLFRIPNKAGATSWLANKKFTMAGWGLIEGAIAPDSRRTASGSYAAFPYGTLNMMLIRGDRCATVQPGDSGSPLLWTTNGRRMVIGVAQGVESCGGRYVATWGPGGVDAATGFQKPHIGAWLQRSLRVTSVDWERLIGALPTTTRIAACQSGALLQVTRDGFLMRHDNPTSLLGPWHRVARVPGDIRSLVCSQDRPRYLTASGELFSLDLRSGSYVSRLLGAPRDAARIAATDGSVLGDPAFFAVNHVGSFWNNRSGGRDGAWVRMPGSLDAVAFAASRDRVYYVTSTGVLMVANTTLQVDDVVETFAWGSAGMLANTADLTVANRGNDDVDVLYRLDKDGSVWRGTPVQGGAP